jgi:uncharacterized protein (TIGR03067 family)
VYILHFGRAADFFSEIGHTLHVRCGGVIMLRFAILGFVFAPAVALAAPVPKALKAKSMLDGRWQTVERFVLGEDVSATQAMEWVVEGDQLTLYDRQSDGRVTLAAPDATVTLTPPKAGGPNELDFLFVEGDRRQLFKGRAEWDGEEVMISFGQPDADRPDEVKSTPAVYHYRLKRVKDK